MLVTRVLGECPACGFEIFGNVSVLGDFVLRGCGRCNYSQRIYLPPVRKKVLYLDQPFFSGAFRGGDRRFVELADRIERIAASQLLTIPRSNIHEAETRLWARADELLEFIKTTSRGHKFESDYRVERSQIIKGFRQWLDNGPVEYPIEQREALTARVHEWDSYFIVDVRHAPGDTAQERENKRQSTENLVNLFDGWRQSNDTFEQDVAGELDGAKRIYLSSYLRYFARVGQGDFAALLDSPIVSKVVEGMRHLLPREMPFPMQLERCALFFDSQHFAHLPFQYIRARSFAVLKAMVKAGAYANRERALQKLSGFYSDVDHIAHYAPYCDAIALDQPMAELTKHPGLALEEAFGVKVFSLNNLAEFTAWLDELEASMTDEHQVGLRAAYA
ncbi:hypothetical protein J5837_10195 [Pseudoxanthomonas helianthi]|uniref:Uncharacterized protein n=1 Tax=Pseudoxanthomonas helianthi TaxID=1453541 RepID=A0A940X322_9GAMM|nr:hypothetical protein [Pseudoxanthomonas helianthi]MBP3984785.1 hypothetical protein [Pseudoxanthomonas helianthi]